MDTIGKLERLEHLYRLFDEFTATIDTACREGCATCCTRNVTMTTLEGRYLVSSLDGDGRRKLREQLSPMMAAPRFQPTITTNGLARMCVNREAPPEEDSDPAWTPCPLLTDDRCPVYDRRPFGCRCMSSRRVCAVGGAADMDAFTLTVNDVMVQVIEHIDAGGCTANMIDMLDALLEDADNGKAGNDFCRRPPFVSNIPIPMLMVPPDHQARIRPLLERINQLL